MESTESISYDEPTTIRCTGTVDTGSVKKYVETVDTLECSIRGSSVGLTGRQDGDRVFSVSFRSLTSAPDEVTRLVESENPDLLD